MWSKHTLTTPAYFQGGQDTQPPGFTPMYAIKLQVAGSMFALVAIHCSLRIAQTSFSRS